MCSHKVHSNTREAISLLCLKDNSFWVMADPADANVRNKPASHFLTWHYKALSDRVASTVTVICSTQCHMFLQENN